MFKKLLSYIFPINLHKTSSEINESIEVTLYNGELLLDSKNVNYSYGSLQKVLRFALNKIGFEQIRKMQNILILGVAGGSVIKTLKNEIGYKQKIKAVELDAKIIKIANEYFDLDKTENLEIIIADAEKFVKTENQKYDLIIVDIFQDENMPDFLFDKTFTDNLQKLLFLNGIILFNTMITNDNHSERNKKYILNYNQENFDFLDFNNIEKFNEVFIIKKIN